MGRGDAKRKRENRALRAAAEKQGKDPGLVLDKRSKGKKSKERPDDGMPASLRKMLQLKAVAEGKVRPHGRGGPAQQGQQRGQGGPRAAGGHPADQQETGSQQDQADGAGDGAQEQQRPSKRQRHESRAAAPEEPAKPTLKARKKEFLKRKKLRKQGKAVGVGDESGEDSDPEARLQAAAAATRPKFGETSAQPISANLKRRHWTEAEKKVTDSRLTALFKKQLAAAGKVASEATRLEAVEAYRKKKKGAAGAAPTATLKSLAALVEKEHVASM